MFRQVRYAYPVEYPRTIFPDTDDHIILASRYVLSLYIVFFPFHFLLREPTACSLLQDFGREMDVVV